MTIKTGILHLKFQRNFQVTKTKGDDKAKCQIDMRHHYEGRILIIIPIKTEGSRVSLKREMEEI